MKNHKNISRLSSVLSLVFILFILVGCDDEVADPSVDFRQIIDNLSSQELLLAIDSDTISIPPDSDYLVNKVVTIGKIASYDDCSLDDVPELNLEVSGSDTLQVTIDPNSSLEWQFELIEENELGGGVGECRLIIDDDDIQ
ncbi:MAG: hypothetical protein HKN45_09735 [Flavobacteriales bacterium]|nr:hypothetical protein [Flavobacteriales bacterium]